jgi:hypothetical protein
MVLYLDNQHRLLERETLFAGSVNHVQVHPREVVKSALCFNAAAVVLAHNHPSGDPEPSQCDRNITGRLKEALALVDVNILDHLVVGSDGIVSFAEQAGYEVTSMKSTESENDSFLKWGLNRNVTPCFGARLVQEGNRLHYLADRASITGAFSNAESLKWMKYSHVLSARWNRC